MQGLMLTLITGVSVGAVYALVALGFVVVFKATDVLNFAHGHFIVIGAYASLLLVEELRMGVVTTLLTLISLGLVVGAGIHHLLMRWTIGTPLFTKVMVTIGLSLIIQSVLLMLFGSAPRTFDSPVPQDPILFSGVRISTANVVVLAVSGLLVVGFIILMLKTRLGIQLRATAANPEAALLMGINRQRVLAIAWGIAVALGLIAGFFMATVSPLVTPAMSAVGMRAFPAAVLGGLTSLPGAIVGGLMVGVAEQMAAYYIGSESQNAVAFGLLLLVLVIRPQGLFGQKVEKV